MGGRGSGGGHNAGGKLSKNIGAGITDRNELVNLYRIPTSVTRQYNYEKILMNLTIIPQNVT